LDEVTKKQNITKARVYSKREYYMVKKLGGKIFGEFSKWLSVCQSFFFAN